MSHQVTVAQVIDIDNRARIILEGIDDEITQWFLSDMSRPLYDHLGMDMSDYGLFLFRPMTWARNYVRRLHGE